MKPYSIAVGIAALLFSVPFFAQDLSENPFTKLMSDAAAHAKAHGAPVPTLSPVEQAVLGQNAKPRPSLPAVDIAAQHAMGIKVVVWTTDDAETMRAEIALGVDGIITNQPDILHKVVAEKGLKSFDESAHRGGRSLRPENTLPSFENGMDEGATTLETDTGVSTDHKSTIWHDQYYNPESCRRADGASYTMENRIWLRDISSTDAAKTLICDKVHADLTATQKNDLALSPVAVAFAKKDGMPSPYAPTYVDQLYRFVRYYTWYYAQGPGKSSPHAKERAYTGAHVRFNIETKSVPEAQPMAIAAFRRGEPLPFNTPGAYEQHTVDTKTFVDTLAGTIMREHMEGRTEVQSFDFRTLRMIEERYTKIPTYYLTNGASFIKSQLMLLDAK